MTLVALGSGVLSKVLFDLVAGDLASVLGVLEDLEQTISSSGTHTSVVADKRVTRLLEHVRLADLPRDLGIGVHDVVELAVETLNLGGGLGDVLEIGSGDGIAGVANKNADLLENRSKLLLGLDLRGLRSSSRSGSGLTGSSRCGCNDNARGIQLRLKGG